MLADRFFGWFGFVAVMTVVAVPIMWPLAAEMAGRFLPVVTRAEVVQAVPSTDGAAVFVRFEKRRQCEFVGLSWYDTLDRRLRIDFAPHADNAPRSRPVGRQYTGPWLLYGVTDIEGTRATVTHRCHPFWLTYTTFYP